MTITKTQNGADLVIAIDGRLDTVTAPELENEFNTSLGAIDSVTLDFSNLEYISSAGLRTLLVGRKLLSKGSIKVINANDLVKEVFEVTGFNNVITIE